MTTSRSLDEAFLSKKIQAYERHHMDGILKFQPKDFSRYVPSLDEIMTETNHRFKGYPGNSMISPREPIRSRAIDDPHLQLFARTHHFDKGKPTIDEGHYSIRYGEQIPVDSGTPKPIAGTLYPERSSAEHRKLRKHQVEAENDLQKFKMEKLQRALNQSDEKKRDWNMLKSYNPWGKPGGGAPKEPDNRKHKFLDEEVGDSPRKAEATFNDQFGRPGGGAPLRTNSGHIKTEISGDPNIRFHQAEHNHVIRQQIGENMRYVTRQDRGRQYANELDQQIVQRALAEQEKRLAELKQEYEMAKHHPYGKPGAGAPNMSQSERKSTQSDQNVNVYDPWGKGYGVPNRDREGNIINSRWSDGKSGIKEYEDYRVRGATLNKLGEGEGGGAPLRTESGQVRATRPITLRADERGVPLFNKPPSLASNSKDSKSEFTIKEEIPGRKSQESPQNYMYPSFGTAGGGAPNRDTNGNVITHIYAKDTLERDSADQRRKARLARDYLTDLESERDMQQQKRLEEKRYRRAPIGELARIVNDGQVGKPRRDPYTGELGNQALPFTDVTKDRTGYVSKKNDHTKDYHTELQRAAEERHRIRRIDGFKEKQESRQHHEVFGEFFGRPGGGAPNPAGPRRHDTDEVVYSPRKDGPTYYDTKDWSQYMLSNRDGDDEKHNYVKSYDDDFLTKANDSPRQLDKGNLPNSYIRSTVNSTHGNQYEYYVPQEPLSKNHQIDIPYATH